MVKSSNSKCRDGKSRKKQYKGVRMRSWGSWVSEIRAPNQKTRIWLGSYSTAEAAARAYDAALLCLKGSHSAAASLNFPLDADYAVPPSATAQHLQQLSPKSIQRVAAAAAANATTAPSRTPPSPSPSASNYYSPDSHHAASKDNSSSYCCSVTAAVVQEADSVDSWLDSAGAFQYSPNCVELMLNGCGFFFDPQPLPQAEEYFDHEVSDTSLWSFC